MYPSRSVCCQQVLKTTTFMSYKLHLHFPLSPKKCPDLSGLRPILVTGNPLKMMKNPFYFTLKLFLFSRYSSVCLEFLITHKNSLTRKIRLISKSMTSQPRLQTITIHILPNILRSKGNQTMKFAQFTEYI